MVDVAIPLVKVAKALQRMRVENANEPSEDLIEAVEEICEISDEKSNNTDDGLLMLVFRRWLDSALDRFKESQNAQIVFTDFCTWYKGSRFMLSPENQKDLDLLTKEQPFLGSPSEGDAATVATRGVIRDPPEGQLNMETSPVNQQQANRDRARSSVDALRKLWPSKVWPCDPPHG